MIWPNLRIGSPVSIGTRRHLVAARHALARPGAPAGASPALISSTAMTTLSSALRRRRAGRAHDATSRQWRAQAENSSGRSRENFRTARRSAPRWRLHRGAGARGIAARDRLRRSRACSASVACMRPGGVISSRRTRSRCARTPSSNLAAARQARDAASTARERRRRAHRSARGRPPPTALGRLAQIVRQRRACPRASSRRAASAAISPSSARRMNSRSRTSLRRNARDERAVLRLDPHQPLEGEPADRRRNRKARDAEPLAQAPSLSIGAPGSRRRTGSLPSRRRRPAPPCCWRVRPFIACSRRCEAFASPLPADMLDARETARRRQSALAADPGGIGDGAMDLTEAATLPRDGYAGALAGRVWRPDVGGPSVVAVRADGVFDVSRDFPTMRDLCEAPDPAAALRAAQGERIGSLADILANTPPDGARCRQSPGCSRRSICRRSRRRASPSRPRCWSG